jgi:xanthine dehydrogenase small subunit
MGKISFYLNDRLVECERPQGMVLADYLRGDERLTGVRIGCREGECGACTVLVGKVRCGVFSYQNVASCLMPLGQVQGAHVLTIEGINPADGGLNPVQQAFLDNGATQCGFCTPGFILSLTAFFCNSEDLSLADALDAVDGNICRCTGYEPIRRAILALIDTWAPRIDSAKPRLAWLAAQGFLPEICLTMEENLTTLGVSGEVPEPDAILVAGATDLLVQKPDTLLASPLHFLEAPGCGVREVGDSLRIAGTFNVSRLREDETIRKHFKKIREQTARISSTIMRNRATIAGNIVNASPIGDLSIMFLALGAKLHIRSGEKVRERELDGFFQGYKKYDLAQGEVIEELAIHLPGKESRFAFDKVAMRRYLDIAACNAALRLDYDGKTMTNVRIAAGGVAPVPLLLKQAAAVAEGKAPGAAMVRECAAAALAEVTPIDDVRGSAAYKKTVLRQILFGLFLELFPETLSFEELVP